MAGISARLRAYECLTALGGCGAQPGENCVTRTGTPTAEVHAARWDQSHAGTPAGPEWLDQLAADMDHGVWDPLIAAMLDHGEDPADDELWRARKAQLALALRERADRRAES